MHQAILTRDILNKISEYLENDTDKLLPILTFLIDHDNQRTARYLTVLRSVSNNDVAFNKIVDKLAEDTQILKNDSSDLPLMSDVWGNYVKPNENNNVGVNGQRFDFRLHLSKMRRCSKNILDSFAGMAAGLGGGIVGATAGSSIVNGFGLRASTPMAMGSIIGAVIFGVTSATAANNLSDWLTQKLFDLPKDAELEHAYNFLGLDYGASNDEINSNFRQLAQKYHPDKGGSEEDWQKLQIPMNKIKLSKNEI